VLNVVSVYSRLKDVTDSEATSIPRKESMVGEATGSGSEHGDGKRRRRLRIKARTRASQIVRTRRLPRMLGEVDPSTTTGRAEGTNHEDGRSQRSSEEDKRFKIELEHFGLLVNLV
jgi:hypothetical protein